MKVFSGLISAGCLAFAAAQVQACDAMHGGAHGGMSLMEMDKNGDGAISRKEFDAFHAAYFKELDADRDGKVTAGEIEAAHKKNVEKCDVSVDARFDETDVNGDGVLSRDEAEIGMPMLFARFDDIDTNKDGKISKDEVAASMKKMHEKVHGKPEEGGMKPIQK